jgi:hypothetical protein
MSATSVYSNHAGTLSDSFAIGKRGIKLLQGTSDPAGITAPIGSLYLLRGGSNKVYQTDGSGTWTVLLSPSSIIAGDGVDVSEVNGIVTVSKINTKYKQQFSNSDLSSGSLTIEHNLSEDFPLVQLYNNSRQLVVPDGVSSTNTNELVINLQSYGSITGDWSVTVISE